jgi:putative ABC transport system ATP-binding protein
LEKVGLSNRKNIFQRNYPADRSSVLPLHGPLLASPRSFLQTNPTGNLDSAMGNEIMDILIQLNKTEGTTIVMVTHDEHMAGKHTV